MKRPPEDYIVFPLDVPDPDTAMGYVRLLRDRVGLFKVGLELFISAGPNVVRAIHETAGQKVFLDLKLHDIPATMRRAFMAAGKHGPKFITVHCDHGDGFLKEMVREDTGGTGILAVSLLTSLGPADLTRLGFREDLSNDIPALVMERARMAVEAGCHGLVCSGREVRRVKQEWGQELIVVTPGIRPAWTLVHDDDQKRVVTPGQAVMDGADYIVIGRPIRDAQDPAEAAGRVAEEISSAL